MADIDEPVTKRQKVYHGISFSGQSKVHAGDVYGNVTNNETHNYYTSAQQNTVDQTAESVRAALFITDPEIDRASIVTAKGNRVANTCEWILQDPTYVSWTDGGHPLLWISGGPGKGKTMMSVFLTQHLEQQSCPNGKRAIYCFCDHQDERRNTAAAVLRGLIWQLCGLHPGLAGICSQDYDSSKRANYTNLSVDALWTIFLRIIRVLPQETPCVIDGLDECDQESIRFLASNLVTSFKTSSKQPHPLRIAVVSRNIDTLNHWPRIRLDPDNDDKISHDIEKFVSARMELFSGPPGFTKGMCKSIHDALMQRAEGTFLWVGFAVHELQQKTTCTEILETVHSLPKGLPAIYGRILLLIEERHWMLSALIIQWVLMATRPLSLAELAAAVGVTGNEHLSVSQVMQDHIRHCGPLFRVDETSLQVGLVHQSAYDYLTRAGNAMDPRHEQLRINPGEAHAKIADACVTCISGSILRRRSLQERDKLWSGQSALLRYAVSSWPEHARAASSSIEAMFRASSFFELGSSTFSNWTRTFSEYIIDKYDCSFCTACYLGLLSWVEILLEGTDTELVNHQCTSGSTPLVRAIEGGHSEMVAILTHHGADVNQKTARGQSPLELAFEDQDDAITAELISSGAQLHEPTTMDDSILFRAIVLGRDHIAKLMIQAGARFVIDPYGRRLNALHLAAQCGNASVLVTLLENGVSSQELDNGKTALFVAATQGHDHVLEILIDWEPDILAVNEYTYCLREAVSPKNEKVVVRLLQCGADATSTDQSGVTPLHRAAAVYGNQNIVRVLLESGADPGATTQASQRTPLGEAICNDANEETVQLLLAHGSGLCSSIDFGFSLLHVAAIRNDGAVICSALLLHGADVRASDKAGRTPLHYAVMFGKVESIKCLLDFGADGNASDYQGNTPLHFANAALLFNYNEVGVSPVSLRNFDRMVVETSGVSSSIDLFCERSSSLSTILIERGADASRRNAAGETPEDLFRTQGFMLKIPPGCDRRWYEAVHFRPRSWLIRCTEFLEIALRSTCDLFDDLDFDRDLYRLGGSPYSPYADIPLTPNRLLELSERPVSAIEG